MTGRMIIDRYGRTEVWDYLSFILQHRPLPARRARDAEFVQKSQEWLRSHQHIYEIVGGCGLTAFKMPNQPWTLNVTIAPEGMPSSPRQFNSWEELWTFVKKYLPSPDEA